MAKRNTETLFLRVDPEVARLVRRACERREQTLGQFAEVVFRQYMVQTTTEEDRKNLLSSVEEALVARVDRRLADALERIAGLYAKEAFDHAEGLYLIKSLVAMSVRDESMTERYLAAARKEATDRLRHRAGPEAGALGQAREMVDQLRTELGEVRRRFAQEKARAELAEKQVAELKERSDALNKKTDSLETTLHEQNRLLEWMKARDEWAVRQFDAQGLLGRKSLQEWRTEYARQHPAPKVG